MRHIALTALAVVFLAMGSTRGEAADAQASTTPPAVVRPAHFTLVDAAPSVEALIDRLLVVLEQSDTEGLHRLRVTEDEYLKFLLPGGGKPGEPAQVFDANVSKFAWQKVDTNSKYAAASIIRGYGGHKYTVQEVKFLKGRQEYAWYTAYKTVGLTLKDESGRVGELVLGSIADVDGQFKFISLLGNR